MSVNNPLFEWWDKPDWFVTIEKGYNKVDINLEVGENPKIACNFSIKRFLESIKENDLKIMIMLCELRLKCLKK